MRRYLLFLFLTLSLTPAGAQPKYEVRAAWVTAVYGLDWPQTKATTPAGIRRQQEELIEILDKLKAANFNTVLFQTRTRGDVLYKSSIEPYNSILTGKVDGDPGYDPLAFAVRECHKRGMECHAWMVALPLGNKKHVAKLGNKSVTKKRKEICIPYKNEYFLNPGHPSTKEYLMKLVREVVTRYDVDGVHFDYLRYPENAPRFPDSYDFRRYGKGRCKRDQTMGKGKHLPGRKIQRYLPVLFTWLECFPYRISRSARMDGRRYTRPDLPHDVFPTEQFLSFRTRLAGTMQRPADYTGIGYLLPASRRRKLDTGGCGPANQLYP